MEDIEEFNSNINRPDMFIQKYITMREYLNPPKLSTPSCFAMPQN